MPLTRLVRKMKPECKFILLISLDFLHQEVLNILKVEFENLEEIYRVFRQVNNILKVF